MDDGTKNKNIGWWQWLVNSLTMYYLSNAPKDVLAPSNEGYSDALPLLFEDKLNEKTQVYEY